MFATRANQENAVHQQQTATAAKNQNLQGLAPKTPGLKPKTPFKANGNDENAAFGPGKTGGKGKNGGLFGDGKGGKADQSAFVTPAGPRTRAPLGAKTTNAKTNVFRTPAAPQSQEQLSAKPTSPRMRRGKVKVLQSEAELQHDAGDREIEHMPPREVPLPDYPDDCWPNDRTYPQFEGKNFTRGWWSEYAPKKHFDEADDHKEFVAKLEKLEKQEAEEKAKKAHAVVKAKPVPTKQDPLKNKAPSTIAARKASSALGSRTGGVPSFAAPTAAAKARAPGPLASKKPVTGASATGNIRHTAARAASNTTLGYSKGRSVSAVARRPLDQIHQKQEEKPATTVMPFGGGTTLDQLLGLSLQDDTEDDELGGKPPSSNEDDALDDFQLDAFEL